jgi:hypothetical protein
MPQAGLDAVIDYAARLDSQALDCRARGHRWDSHRVTYDRQAKEYDEQEVCSCGATRHTTYDADGYITGRRIGYPEGYLMPAGSGRITRSGRAAIRRERLSRARPVRASRRAAS